MTAASQQEEGVPSSTPCPPADAVVALGMVYRCAKQKPAHPDEMKTHYETGRLPDADFCLRRALSVFRIQRDAEHQVLLFRRWKRKFVLRTELALEHGWTKATDGQQPTHTSWWPAEKLTPKRCAALFIDGIEVRV